MAKPLLLDTSVILNIIATGSGLDVVKSLERECFVCTAVAAEAIYIRGEDSAQPLQLVSVQPWIESGKVGIVSPEGLREEELYVQFAADLDDGEAMSLAICVGREYVFATDDRKARRVAGSQVSAPVDLLSTPEILHAWSSGAGIPGETLREAILRVETKARFKPAQSDPLFEWWLRGLSEEKAPFDSR